MVTPTDKEYLDWLWANCDHAEGQMDFWKRKIREFHKNIAKHKGASDGN